VVDSSYLIAREVDMIDLKTKKITFKTIVYESKTIYAMLMLTVNNSTYKQYKNNINPYIVSINPA
jgi:hypothetical protein